MCMMDVKNVLVVVSRWWGGILLGPGLHDIGLIRQIALNTLTMQLEMSSKSVDS